MWCDDFDVIVLTAEPV